MINEMEIQNQYDQYLSEQDVQIKAILLKDDGTPVLDEDVIKLIKLNTKKEGAGKLFTRIMMVVTNNQEERARAHNQ